MRLTLPAVLALAAVVVAGCGGSSDRTLSVGDGATITIPSDVHGVYGETETILEALPYQQWYTACVMRRIKERISPGEAESLAELSGSEGEEKVTKVINEAEPACEKATGRPPIDPNASAHELDLLRAEYAPSLAAFVESNGLTGEQVACVEHNFEDLPNPELIAMSNGSHKAREGILVSLVKPCAKVK